MIRELQMKIYLPKWVVAYVRARAWLAVHAGIPANPDKLAAFAADRVRASRPYAVRKP